MLKNLIMVGGSAMIMKEIADRVRQARIDRKKTLRLKKAGILALGVTIVHLMVRARLPELQTCIAVEFSTLLRGTHNAHTLSEN